MEMPKFDFSNATIRTEEEFAAAEATSGQGDKYLNKPGKYEVVIDSVEYKGLSEKDTNWGKLEVVYKGSGDRTIKDFIQIPFKDTVYGEKKSTYPLKKLRSFCGALGHTINVTTIGDTMKSVFGRPEKLKGQSLSIEIGYNRGHIKYMGKTTEGAKRYQIYDRDNNPVRTADLAVVEFPDFDAALAYAGANNVQVDKFPQILVYAKGAAATAAPANTNW